MDPRQTRLYTDTAELIFVNAYSRPADVVSAPQRPAVAVRLNVLVDAADMKAGRENLYINPTLLELLTGTDRQGQRRLVAAPASSDLGAQGDGVCQNSPWMPCARTNILIVGAFQTDLLIRHDQVAVWPWAMAYQLVSFNRPMLISTRSLPLRQIPSRY